MSAKLHFDDARHAPPLFAGTCVGLWAKVVLLCEPLPELGHEEKTLLPALAG